jgi:hypothetical protein
MTQNHAEDPSKLDGQNLKEIQTLEAVAERDIDLLLIEELHVDSSFRSWFYELVWGASDHDLTFLGAWHSLTDSEHGESDIVVLVEGLEGRKLAILIEDKIDAITQPNQAGRYRIRGDAGIEKEWWHQYRTCIVAPQAYLDANSEAKLYDVPISYESIKQWFTEKSTDHRATYKAQIIENAIEQNRRGYRAIPHGGVTQFWLDYWELSRTEFPELQMRKPTGIPANSDWPRFKPKGLNSDFVVIHKWRRGAVDLTIRGAGDNIERLTKLNGPLLSDDLSILTTNKSAAIRVEVPLVDRFGELAPQINKARAGLLAASRLIELSHQLQL